MNRRKSSTTAEANHDHHDRDSTSERYTATTHGATDQNDVHRATKGVQCLELVTILSQNAQRLKPEKIDLCRHEMKQNNIAAWCLQDTRRVDDQLEIKNDFKLFLHGKYVEKVSAEEERKEKEEEEEDKKEEEEARAKAKAKAKTKAKEEDDGVEEVYSDFKDEQKGGDDEVEEVFSDFEETEEKTDEKKKERDRVAGVGIALGPIGIAAWKRAGKPDPVHGGVLANGGRIMGLELHFLDPKSRKIKVFLISAYLPHSGYSDADYTLCTDKLTEMITKRPKDTIAIVGMDANARAGTRRTLQEDDFLEAKLLGPFGNPDINKRGRMLYRDVMVTNQLCSPTSFKEKRCTDDFNTWTNPNTKLSHQIDYILISKPDYKRVINCKRTSITLGSDHFANALIMRLSKFTPKKGLQDEKNDSENDDEPSAEEHHEPDWDQLKGKIAQEYNTIVSDFIAKAFQDGNVDLIKVFMDACKEASKVIPAKEKKPEGWFALNEEELKPVLEARFRAREAYSRNKCPETKKELNRTSKQVRKAIQKAKDTWLDQLITECNDLEMNPYQAWVAAKKIVAGVSGHHKKMTTIRMKRPDGTLAESDKESAKILADYFKNHVFGIQSKYDDDAVDALIQLETDESLGEPPTLEEMLAVLKKMKPKKSPGENGLPAEAYKRLNDTNMEHLHRILVAYWNDPTVDADEFHKVVLKLIPKKGDLRDPSKWRPIALLDVMSKILSAIVAKRLDGYQQEHGLAEQAGFISKRGCPDATTSLKIALQNLRARGQEAHVLFVDLVKAFDSVNREMLWKILAKYGLPEKLISVIKKLYTDITIDTKVGKTKESFASTSGVKQGDNLAPVLFLFAIQAAIDTMDQHWPVERPQFAWFGDDENGRPQGVLNPSKTTIKGMDFSLSHFVKSLYADDAAFLFLNRKDIIKGTRFIVETFSKFGLTVHLGSRGQESKTEAMHFPGSQETPSTPEDTDDFVVIPDGKNSRFVSYCDTFKYLGTFLTPQGDDEHDIQSRLTSATQMFGMMKDVLCNKSIAQHVRRKLYKSTVLSVLLFGCESWALKKTHRDMLEVFHTKRVRRMLGINMFQVEKYRIKNSVVLERFGISDLRTITDTRIIRFITKIALMPEERITRRMATSFYAPNGQESLPAYTRSCHTRSTWVTLLSDRDLLSKKDANNFGAIYDAVLQPDWSTKVESSLDLKPGSFFNSTYSQMRECRHANAVQIARQRQLQHQRARSQPTAIPAFVPAQHQPASISTAAPTQTSPSSEQESLESRMRMHFLRLPPAELDRIVKDPIARANLGLTNTQSAQV